MNKPYSILMVEDDANLNRGVDAWEKPQNS